MILVILEWAPNAKEFCVCYGFMPSKVWIFFNFGILSLKPISIFPFLVTPSLLDIIFKIGVGSAG